MNRRKLFGVLAAPVAASVPVKSEFQSNLKPYSSLDYDVIFSAWSIEYLRKAIDPSSFSGVFCRMYPLHVGDWTYSSIGHTRQIQSYEVKQAFADACLNGEVPGVWWE